MKKIFMLIGCLILFIGCLTPAYAAPNPLLGTWVTNVDGKDIELTFYSDGTFFERTDAQAAYGAYSTEGNRVTFDAHAMGTITYEFEVKGNQLISTIIHAVIDGDDVTPALRGTTVTYITTNPLFTTWVTKVEGQDVELTYYSDGTFSERTDGLALNGTYSTAGNRITMSAPTLGIMTYELELRGNQLTCTIIHAVIDGDDVTPALRGTAFTYTRK